MSREQYQVPTSPTFDGGNPASSQAAQPTPREGTSGPAIIYLCGDCSQNVFLTRGDAIRCPNCGHRVLYKERTKRMVQFEAR